MELGPDLIALLTQLQEIDPTNLKAMGASIATPVANPAPVAAVLPPGTLNGLSLPPRMMLEKFGPSEADLLLPHYVAYMPPFKRIFPGSKDT
jgi:hypothetical protein